MLNVKYEFGVRFCFESMHGGYILYCIASYCWVTLSHRKTLTLFGVVNKVNTLILMEEGFGLLIKIRFGSSGVLEWEINDWSRGVKQPT